MRLVLGVAVVAVRYTSVAWRDAEGSASSRPMEHCAIQARLWRTYAITRNYFSVTSANLRRFAIKLCTPKVTSKNAVNLIFHF